MRTRLNRRSFLKRSGAAAAVTLTAEPMFAGPHPAMTPANSESQTLPINRGWRYRDTATPDARTREFDDTSFAEVCLPHTNVRLPWHSFSEKAFQFTSVYRRNLKLPANLEGKSVLIDFEGVMTASTVYLNGQRVGGYKGGYTPFSFDLTPYVDKGGRNVLVVEVDSSERSDIPPFGDQVDYLTFGGIYREVQLRIVPQQGHLENVFAMPKDVLSAHPSLEVRGYVRRAPYAPASKAPLTLCSELRDGDRIIASGSAPINAEVPAFLPNADAGQALGAQPFTDMDKPQAIVQLSKLGKIELWDLKTPKLYTVHTQLLSGNTVLDSQTRRIGFRDATFTDQGFSLNGKVIKLHGLDRHQTFPWVGQAMPGRVQRKDAELLRTEYHCNIVRTSHYPQSRHFLDACDEVGLLVLEEIPGWQHIGPLPWQDISVDNVRRMVRRDWNHPSIVLWGVRINESRDNHDFYVRTNAMAHAFDQSRQTGGIRYFQESEFLEDVFTMNDFGFPLKPPVHGKYLNTEFVGHTFPTKTIDSLERLREHTHRHARVHDQLASNPQYAGGIGWCAFDYNTHSNFGSGDHICYHGVFDIFRTPKPAAYLYKAMCDPSEEVVLELGHHWARNDQSTEITAAEFLSNCDSIKAFLVDKDGEHELQGGPNHEL
ncbi:MAG: twin-arginine translocation signal domain-containing protein, partial [Terriglobus roseus]|nr:twin-arginine translocation signal domain-containing protein [Terriglobus roseus]